MARIYLVRHGKAAADWDADLDPGLDDLGKSQAEASAEYLAPLGPFKFVSSPLARAQETASPLAQAWRVVPEIEIRVSEIPSPTENLTERIKWLRNVMGDNWSNLGPELQDWRAGVIETIRSFELDTVVFSHFIAINVIVGEAAGDDRVVVFLPDNGSVTEVDVDGGRITLIKKGLEAGTTVG